MVEEPTSSYNIRAFCSCVSPKSFYSTKVRNAMAIKIRIRREKILMKFIISSNSKLGRTKF